MSYLGQVELKSSEIRRIDVTGSTSATHTLTWTPASEQSLIITINGIKQQNNYSFSGTTLTLDDALLSADKMEVIGILDIGEATIPPDDSITTAMVKDDAIDADKLANSINTEIAANTAKVTNATHTGDVTGATALTIAVDAVDIAMLSATGTASSSTFLRGDNAWTSAGLSGWSEDGGDNDLLPASASAGIYLGVNSATAANLLDDYETGTWTMVLSDGSNAMTLAANTAYYTKIGNMVAVSGYINVSSVGSSSGAMDIYGLPFTVGSSRYQISSFSVGYAEVNIGTAGANMGSNPVEATTQIDLRVWDHAATTTSLLASEIAVSSVWSFSGIYII